MATIYDVAKAVGLSHTAVSAVLNNKPSRVSIASRQRIVEAAERMGYRTNRAAQQLATGKFDTIALCFERAWEGLFLHPTVNQLVAGVGVSASENGLFLLFAPSAPEDRFESTIESIPLHGVDGAIIVGALHQQAITAIDRCRLPLVCIDSYTGFVRASSVDQDNRAGIRRGVEHLIANGHRKLAFVSRNSEFQCLLDRLAGFEGAVADAGLSAADQTIELIEIADAPETLSRLLDAPHRPTAIVAGEEGVTFALLDELTRRGMSVPDDISVLGVDDGTYPHPLFESINIVRSAGYEMGKAAGNLLKKVLDDERAEPVIVRLPPDLVLRACPNRR